MIGVVCLIYVVTFVFYFRPTLTLIIFVLRVNWAINHQEEGMFIALIMVQTDYQRHLNLSGFKSRNRMKINICIYHFNYCG